MSTPAPTLEQLAVFVAVAEFGGFSAAARRLNRTQSVISYSVARLEAQLGLTLFDRDKRHPTLTPAGEAMLGDARRAGFLLDQLLARARGLTQGMEAEVSLAIDPMVPSPLLARVCQAFAERFPALSLLLRVEDPASTIRLVQSGACVIAICGPILDLPDDIDRRHCGVVQLIPVVGAAHPLAGVGESLTTAMLRDHTQLVLNERTPGAPEAAFAAYAVQAWRISDLALIKNLLISGIGWATMPELMVAADLKAGRLKRLAKAGAAEWPYPLDLIRRIDTPPKPATQWLAERLIAEIAAPR